MTEASPESDHAAARPGAEMLRLAALFGGGLLLLAGLVLLVPSAPEPEPDVLPEHIASDPLPDFTDFADVNEKKDRFFDYLLPMVEHRNAWVQQSREFLAEVRARIDAGEQLSRGDRERVEALAQRYRLELDGEVDPKVVDELLLRADQLPPSLVLAQAAAESAWGTSRFARSANNLFGQWCFSKGCGLVPGRRPEGASHEVQRFETVADAVDSYFRNLNSHDAYETVRLLRARARAEGRELSGPELAEGLLRYSERGAEYIHELRAIIRVNDLETLDSPVEPEIAAEDARRADAG